MNHILKQLFSLDPAGDEIAKGDQHSHNLYQMPYDTIRMYDVGTKVDSTYVTSKRISTYKPLYSELISTVKQWCADNDKPIPFFNIEIKRVAKYDNQFHPEAEEFATLVMNQVKLSGLEEKTIIQSFDFESLRIVRREMPHLTLAQLIETRNSPEENVKELGFTPDIYSCYFKMVDKHLIEYAKSQGMKVIPWTVNEPEDIQDMLDIGVDGIISDYPDRVIAKSLVMPIISGDDFSPSRIYRNGHIGTLGPYIFGRWAAPVFDRVRIDTPDHDFLDLDFIRSGHKHLVILCHGLEGSSQSNYIGHFAAQFAHNGYDVLAMNYRGCSGEMNRQFHMYNSGKTDDLNHVVSSFANQYDRIAIVGFSLGGNLTLKIFR